MHSGTPDRSGTPLVLLRSLHTGRIAGRLHGEIAETYKKVKVESVEIRYTVVRYSYNMLYLVSILNPHTIANRQTDMTEMTLNYRHI